MNRWEDWNRGSTSLKPITKEDRKEMCEIRGVWYYILRKVIKEEEAFILE